MARQLNPANGRYDLRADPEEIQQWARAADIDDRSLAQWIVRALNRAAASQLREKTGSKKKSKNRP